MIGVTPDRSEAYLNAMGFRVTSIVEGDENGLKTLVKLTRTETGWFAQVNPDVEVTHW